MEKAPDGGDRVPRIVQVMYFQQMPRQAVPPDSSQPPDNAIPQQWESQWQEFLKTLQPAQIAVGNPPVMESVPWEDAKAFLSSFEEVAGVCQWPRDEWVGRLLPALQGGVKQCLWRLHARDRRDYEKVKSAILRDDGIRTEARRQHFRQCGYQEGPRGIYRRLQELCRQWLKPDKRSKEQILELIVQEQLLAMLPQEVQRTVKECGAENCVEMVTLAENFLVSCQTAKTRERPVPEGTVGSRETEAILPNVAHRQFCVGINRQGNGEIGLMANDMTSMRNSGLVLPPVGQEMTGAQQPAHVKNTASGWPAEDLDQKPSPWELMRQTFGNASAPDGLLIPTPDSLSQPEQQETQIPGQSLPDSFLGYRMPSEIKAEDSGETDVDDDMPVLSPAEYQDDAPASPQPETHHELRPRKQEAEQPGPGRKRRRRGTAVPSKKSLYLANKEKKHECPVCGHKAHFLSDLLRHMKRHAGRRGGKRPYKCLECGISFRKVESFQNHQRSHKSSKSGRPKTKQHVCGTCGFKAISLKHLSEHMTVHTGEKLFNCSECGQKFRWQSNLYRHMRLHEVRKNRGVRQLIHRGGDGRGKLKNYSLQHYRIRLEDVLETPSDAAADGREPSVSSRLRPRRPQEQGYYDPTQLEWSEPEDLLETVLDKPVSRHHSKTLRGRGRGAAGQLGRAAVAVKRSINYRKKKPHSCQQCDYRSERLADVVMHMKVHTRERPYSCHECGITFRWPSNYRSHMKICAASLKTPVPAPVAECDVTLGDEEELINILQKKSQQRGTVGTTSKPLPKEQRGPGRPKRSESNSKYKPKEKKHECLICGHRAFYLSDLIRHHRVHTREKPYKCLQCGKAFTQKCTLASHKCESAPSSGKKHRQNKAREGEKNYSCSKCGHRASKLATLLKHMRVHLGERTYKCQECGEAFAWQSNLCRHQRTYHLDSAPSGLKTPIEGHQEMSAGNEDPSKMLEETSQQERTEPKSTSGTSPAVAQGDVSPAAGGEGSSKEQESPPGEEQAEAAKETEGSSAGMSMLKLLNLEKFAYSKGEKSHQPPSEPVPDPGVSIKEEPCEVSVSEKSDSIKCSLMQYQNEEADEKPHLCEDCGQCFPMKAQLTRHQLTHAGAKPHRCSACGNAYSCEDDLTAHLKTHDSPATADAPSLETAAAGAPDGAAVASDRTGSS